MKKFLRFQKLNKKLDKKLSQNLDQNLDQNVNSLFQLKSIKLLKEEYVAHIRKPKNKIKI